MGTFTLLLSYEGFIFNTPTNCSIGEEEENVLFEARAKLFRLVQKEWKERGIGPVKILEQKDKAGRCRVVMRRDQVHKICLNHGLHGAMSLVPMGDKGNGEYVGVSSGVKCTLLRGGTPSARTETQSCSTLASSYITRTNLREVVFRII